MTRISIARRPGLTLTETLVAMFVAAIGMISLLTLFPLGALQMSQALKDARCTELSINAESLVRVYWRTAVVEAATPDAFTTNFQFTGTAVLSDPVFIDPLGAASNTTNPTLVAGIPGLHRSGLANLTTPARRLRFCSLLDDMTYADSGLPLGAPTTVERAARYNWTAVLQRPSSSLRDVAKFTVLVFDSRAPFYSPPNAELASTISYTGLTAPTVANAASSIKLLHGAARPPVGRGRWFALYHSTTKTLAFYRATSVNDETAGEFLIETQAPIDPVFSDTANTTAVTFAGLAEVFERPSLAGR